MMIYRHTAAIDGYTLQGFQWDRVYPTGGYGNLLLTGRNFLMRADGVDFYNQAVVPAFSLPELFPQTILCSKLDQSNLQTQLYTGFQFSFPNLQRYPWCSIVAKDKNIHMIGQTEEGFDLFQSPLEVGLYTKSNRFNRWRSGHCADKQFSHG